MSTVIQTNHLSKSYHGFQAVKDVSLSIKEGEIYGFIGLNGAGKTTVIRMILGMVRPTHGACYIHNQKVHLSNHHIWNQVGYIVETPHFYPELTVKENLDIYRRLRLILDKNIVSKVMNQLNLTQYADKKAQNLSLGNAQRLGIAKALLPMPKVLILDEPVNGLDPAGIVEVRELLQDLAFNQGVTILISSHLLTEVAKIATKIGIIDNGQLVQEVETVNLNQLLHQYLLIHTKDNNVALSKLLSAGYVAKINDKGLIEISDQAAIEHPDEVSRFLAYEGFPPMKLIVNEEDLEAYFFRTITKKEEIVP
ncbi:ABC transporter ATP-binding protein [Pseudogracilibacillus sp. SO30301A]|uniref:ABC transporter ATP-binding protein n=1 Tax=Pseudogracilibacillus sp. SO30301A TaxID=3098291 RepID=UPI00300E56EE